MLKSTRTNYRHVRGPGRAANFISILKSYGFRPEVGAADTGTKELSGTDVNPTS